MFCPKCGKQMDYDAPYCVECMSATNMKRSQSSVKTEQENISSVMKGFGLALVSAIVGTSCLFSFICVYYKLLAFLYLLLSMFAAVCGVQSIEVFCFEKGINNSRPVATLVLGIVALTFSIVGLFFSVTQLFILFLF